MDFLRGACRAVDGNFDPLIVQIPISDHRDADTACERPNIVMPVLDTAIHLFHGRGSPGQAR